MTTYDDADDDIMAVLAEQLRLHHPDLCECGAVIGVTVASNEKGPAVRHGGHAALATIKAISSKDKTKKKIDAEILIDLSEWHQLHPEQRAALIDHELLHLRRVEYTEKQLAKLRKANPDQPAWKIDEHGRPKMKTVKADVTPGDAWAACIQRHGKAAVEFVTAKRFAEFAEEALKSREGGERQLPGVV